MPWVALNPILPIGGNHDRAYTRLTVAEFAFEPPRRATCKESQHTRGKWLRVRPSALLPAAVGEGDRTSGLGLVLAIMRQRWLKAGSLLSYKEMTVPKSS